MSSDVLLVFAEHISGGRDSGTVWVMPEDLYVFAVDIGFNGCKILCVHLYEDDPGAAHRNEWHCSADRVGLFCFVLV